MTPSAVLDASALMALLQHETGADVVSKSLRGSVISAVNYSEILKKTVERGGPSASIAAFIRDLAVEIIPFDEIQAAGTAELYPLGKPHGMSFADRACLALGVHLGVPVITAERKMRLVTLPIKVKLIRNAHCN